MTAEQLTNPRSNVLTACPERSEGFKRLNAPTFHPSALPSFQSSPVSGPLPPVYLVYLSTLPPTVNRPWSIVN
jgi:hypothetical protein